MEYNETKISTYTREKTRIQLLKMTESYKSTENEVPNILETKFQIRVNRKRIYTTRFEYDARNYFATIIQTDLLQHKIY